MGLVPLSIACISLITFRHAGTVSTLLLGGGMLAVGLGVLVTAVFPFTPGSANTAITIFNLTALFGALLEFAGAEVALSGWRTRTERRPAMAAAVLGGTAVFVGAVTVVTLAGLLPVFFVPGDGSTVVRTVVLTLAIGSFLGASVLLFALYGKRSRDFFFWYAVGLALIGFGLLAVAQIEVFGSGLNLVGRLGQVLGACYLLAAFLVLRRDASARDAPVQAVLASFFDDAEIVYRQLVERGPDAIVVLDARRLVVVWNGAAEQVFGISSDEAVGRSLPALVLFEGGDAVLEEAAGAPREVLARRRDGTRVPVELTAFRHDAGGKIVTTCVVHDLTTRKQSEAALRESEAKYRLLFVHDITGDFVAAADGRILDCNPAFVRMFGFSSIEEALSSKIDETYTNPRDREAMLARLRRDGKLEYDERFRQRRDGTHIHVVENIVGFFDDAGTLVRTQGYIIDDTERFRAEEALRVYAENLRRSNEDLERFAYVASHDLQEPLRPMVSFAQLLKRRYGGALDEEADEYLDFIIEGGNRLQALILDLLAFSRVNTTRQQIAPTDAAAVLTLALQDLDPQLREAGAVVTHDPMPVVMADPAQLLQVFVNLLSNAATFRQPDVAPRIHVGARRADGWWEFSVSDNGIGIEEQYFDRLFVIFQRLHTRDAYPGTGVGLPLVKRIVERHGGRVRVESTPGTGSTFFFTIPAA